MVSGSQKCPVHILLRVLVGSNCMAVEVLGKKFTAQQIKNKIKNSNSFGRLYLAMAIPFVRTLQLFIRPKENQILFISYSGRQFSDTPREAYLSLLEDEKFEDYKLVWAFNRPQDFKKIPRKQKVSSNSPFFFIHLLRSKYWIANTSIDRLVPFDHPRNIYIQFWHGIPMKTLGSDEKGLSPLVANWYENVSFDYLFTYGKYDRQIMESVFPNTKKFLQVGQLRKRKLKRQTERNVIKAKKKLKIPLDDPKPLLLYMPTFRGYESATATSFSDHFLASLSKKYTILYRGHYFSRNKHLLNVYDVTKSSLSNLYDMADLMVTDYSSSLFDFAATRKPIYLFQPDLAEYQDRRGLYLSAKQLKLPVAYSEFMLRSMLKRDYDMKVIDRLEKRFDSSDADLPLKWLKAIIATQGHPEKVIEG